MAATDAPEREPASAHRSVFRDRLDPVLRATGLEATSLGEQRRNCDLVQANARSEERAHNSMDRHQEALATSAVISAQVALVPSTAAPFLAMTTKSAVKGSCARCWRNHSRTTRLTRFRSTAPPTRRLTTRPSREHAGFGVISSAYARDVIRRPSIRDRPYSRLFRTRASARKRCEPRTASVSWAITRPSAEKRRAKIYFELIVGTRRLRPFARRRFSTTRPAFVLMRARNPWVRFRRMRLG